MCKCGCNTCGTNNGPLLTENKVKSLLSEGLQYHIDKKIPLFETVYRIGSDKHLSLIKEARKMYSRNVIDLCEEDEHLIKTHLGEFGLYEGESVPLDLPMLEEEVNSSDLDNAIYRLEKVLKYLDIEHKETRRGEKYIQINYIPVTSPQSYNPEFVNVRYNNDEDLEMIKNRLGLSMLKEEVAEWPEELTSRYSDEYRFELEKVTPTYQTKPGRAKYRVIDIESGELKGTPVFGSVSSLQAFADNLIKPQGGTQSTNLGELLNESYDYDEVAQSEFGMDYDQLGSNEQEWVRDEIDNMSTNEAKKDIYDKFLDNPQNPKGRAKTIISKFLKQYGENATEMAVDRFAKQNDLKPEEKYILKYITKQDIKISSQPGGPDFSALEESKYKKGDKLKVKLKNGKEFNITFDSYSSNKGMAYGKIDGDRKPFSLDAVVNESKKKAKKNTKKDPPIGKPKRGGSKAYYVYVRDPKTKKVKKVSFGSGGLRAKIKNKTARNAFAARHKCSTKKDRTKAGYWSCNLPRYAQALGLGANMNTYW